MIKLKESQIAQILPEHLAEKASVKALSFALFRAVEKLVGYCERVGVFSVIDSMSDEILDLLALELNTQYYDTSLPTESKRKLIKNTFVWYIGAGTPQAVEELVAAVFGEGKVEEWFEYGGEPYCFRVNLKNVEVSHGQNAQFRKMLSKVKRLGAHLDAILYTFYYMVWQQLVYDVHIRITGAFYPRSNIPPHCLEGTTRLDGKYPLNGYLSGKSHDFYPIALQVRGEADGREGMSSDGEAEVCGGAAQLTGTGAAMLVRGAGEVEPCPVGTLQMGCAAGEAGGTAAAGYLWVEKDWGTLDGSRRLNGSRRLDAEAYEVEV